MESNIDQQSTTSEVPNPEVLDDFEKAIRFLSELPTDRAMKDVAKGKYITESIKRVVETMALSKMDIIKSLRHMNAREKSLEKMLSATLIADKAMIDYMNANPNLKIEFTNGSPD